MDICSGQFKAKKPVLLSVIFNWLVLATTHSAAQETATVLTVKHDFCSTSVEGCITHPGILKVRIQQQDL